MSLEKMHKGLDDVLVEETSMASIDGVKGILRYVGIPIEVLAEKSSFAEVVFLLWKKRLPNRKELDDFIGMVRAERDVPESMVKMIEQVPAGAQPMDVLRSLVSSLAFYDKEAGATTIDANFNMAVRILEKAPTAIAYYRRISEGKGLIRPSKEPGLPANYYHMLTGIEPSPEIARGFDASFIIYAEHELNASAFAGLVTGSTLADMYGVITSGISALKGPLHGGANLAAIYMLKEIGDPSKAEDYIMNKLKNKEKISGFGHRIYRTYDPRARVFKKICEGILPTVNKDKKKVFDTALEVERVAIRELGPNGIYPNTDFWNSVYYYFIDIPPEYFTVNFALARIAGWAGHALEYWQANRLIRPRSVYIGPAEAQYVPIEDR